MWPFCLECDVLRSCNQLPAVGATSAAKPPQQSANSAKLCRVVGQRSARFKLWITGKIAELAALPDIVRKET